MGCTVPSMKITIENNSSEKIYGWVDVTGIGVDKPITIWSGEMKTCDFQHITTLSEIKVRLFDSIIDETVKVDGLIFKIYVKDDFHRHIVVMNNK